MKATKQTSNVMNVKPTWLYDKKGNIRKVHQPVNGRGEVITLNPATHNAKIPDSVGFSGFKLGDDYVTGKHI